MKLFKGSLFCIALSLSTSIFAETLKVGISVGPSVQVMELAKKIAKQEYNLDLQLVPFGDYQLPNEALNSADIDANIFQTNSFLQEAIKKKGYDLAVVGNTFIYPMAIYSRKLTSLSSLQKNAVVIIPNDLSNQGRALLLLQQAHLLTLKTGSGELPTLSDVASNPKEFKITAIDAAQVARAVDDAAIVVLNNDFVANAGFNPNAALFKEDPKTAKPYINVIVVRKKDQNELVFKELTAVMHKPAVVSLTEKVSPGAVQAW